MSRICVDLGHGVNPDRGANGFIAEEEIINSVGGLVINKLRALGHDVVECRPSSVSSVSDSLSQRYNKSNNNNVDLFVSIHANAGGGVGTEVFTYNGKELSQARNVLNNLVDLGFRNRGLKDGSGLAVIRNTNAPAMLIEVCFVDTQSDVNKYRSIGAEKIADAIVKGLVGGTVKVDAPQQANPQSNTNISTNLRDWQSSYNSTYDKNILVDGVPGPQTEGALRNACIRKGDNNALVGWVQCRVGAKVDNDFGNETYNKVCDFQRANGLVVDGVPGYNTFKKLLEKFYW